MLQLFKGGAVKAHATNQGKDLPDFETGHSENLRSAVRWVMKVSNSLSFCFTLLVNQSEEPECFNFLLDILRYTNILHEISA